MKKEIFINFLLTIAITIVGFMQNRYFVIYLGLENLGIMKLFTDLLSYLGIVEMGLGSAATFAFYKPLAEKNYDLIGVILRTIRVMYNKIALLIFIAGVILTPFLSFFMKTQSFTKIIYLYWILYLLNTVATYLFIKYSILFTANQDFIKVRLIQIGSKIFYQLVQFIAIIQFKSFFLFIVLLLVDNLTQYLFFKYYYKKDYSHIKEMPGSYPQLKVDIKNLFWHKFAGLIVFNTDLILISKLVSLDAVGVYSSYLMVIQTLKTIMVTISGVLSPRVGKFVSQNSKEDVYALFKKYNFIFMLLTMFLMFPLYYLFTPFLKLWIGYDLPYSTVLLIWLNGFIYLFRGILDVFKECCGFFDDIEAPIIESILNLVISIVLGITIGINGIIIGTLASNVTIILIYKPIITFKRCFNQKMSVYIKLYSIYLASIVALFFIFKEIISIFNLLPNISNWSIWLHTYLILLCIITVILLTTFLIITRCRKQFFNNV